MSSPLLTALRAQAQARRGLPALARGAHKKSLRKPKPIPGSTAGPTPKAIPTSPVQPKPKATGNVVERTVERTMQVPVVLGIVLSLGALTLSVIFSLPGKRTDGDDESTSIFRSKLPGTTAARQAVENPGAQTGPAAPVIDVVPKKLAEYIPASPEAVLESTQPHISNTLPTPPPAVIPRVSSEEDLFVDPETSISFPRTLRIPSKLPLPTYTLVGAGVRKVSFLGVKVYSVGFYADLENPALNIPVTATLDEKIQHIAHNTSCVIRIVPYRATSYNHLRDAFVRSLNNRLNIARTNGTLTPEMEEAGQHPIRKLKSIFPAAAMPQDVPLDVLIVAPTNQFLASAPVPGSEESGNGKDASRERALIVRDLGAVQSDWVAEEFILAYFEKEGSSPPMKKRVGERLESFGKST